MSNFRIGEKVVCVDASNTKGISTGIIYPVLGIDVCDCGCERITVNNITGYLGSRCMDCGAISNNPSLYMARRFRKLSDFLASQSESELTEIEKEFKPVKELELV